MRGSPRAVKATAKPSVLATKMDAASLERSERAKARLEEEKERIEAYLAVAQGGFASPKAKVVRSDGPLTRLTAPSPPPPPPPPVSSFIPLFTQHYEGMGVRPAGRPANAGATAPSASGPRPPRAAGSGHTWESRISSILLNAAAIRMKAVALFSSGANAAKKARQNHGTIVTRTVLERACGLRKQLSQGPASGPFLPFSPKRTAARAAASTARRAASPAKAQPLELGGKARVLKATAAAPGSAKAASALKDLTKRRVKDEDLNQELRNLAQLTEELRKANIIDSKASPTATGGSSSSAAVGASFSGGGYGSGLSTLTARKPSSPAREAPREAAYSRHQASSPAREAAREAAPAAREAAAARDQAASKGSTSPSMPAPADAAAAADAARGAGLAALAARKPSPLLREDPVISDAVPEKAAGDAGSPGAAMGGLAGMAVRYLESVEAQVVTPSKASVEEAARGTGSPGGGLAGLAVRYMESVEAQQASAAPSGANGGDAAPAAASAEAAEAAPAGGEEASAPSPAVEEEVEAPPAAAAEEPGAAPAAAEEEAPADDDGESAEVPAAEEAAEAQGAPATPSGGGDSSPQDGDGDGAGRGGGGKRGRRRR